jgi:hypothetical protein
LTEDSTGAHVCSRPRLAITTPSHHRCPRRTTAIQIGGWRPPFLSSRCPHDTDACPPLLTLP